MWVKGRHLRAEVLYRCTVWPAPHTPLEVTQDYDLPFAAVEETIAYAVHHEAFLAAERARKAARM